MQKYLEYTDFSGTGLYPIMAAVTTAVPLFWPIMIFVFWIVINAASYFAILKLTGKKRFFHTLTSASFVMFLGSLIIASMNTSEINFLSGYWVGWYLIMSVSGWFLLHYYK